MGVSRDIQRRVHELDHRDEQIKQLKKEITGLKRDIRLLTAKRVKEFIDGPRNCSNCKKCRDYKSDWYTSLNRPCSKWRPKVK